MKLRSHAKVNLYLRIVGTRPDGFHDLETLFAPISLYDQIELESIDQGIEIRCNDPMVPTDSRNLAWKAAEKLAQRAGITKGVRITLNKLIPPGSGLGGGSANAATTLLGLNQLWNTNLSNQQLHEIASELGSDVPFFLKGGLCVASGRGEILTPLSQMPEIWMVLVRPDVSVSTPWAYKAFDALSELPKAPPLSELINVLGQDSASIAAYLANDLEAAVFPAYPVIRQIRDELLQAGALGALMSGSGSSVFGIMRDRFHAEQIQSQFSARYLWVHVTRTVREGVEVE